MNMNMLKIFFYIKMAFAYPGENETVRPALVDLQQEGKLVSIRIVRGEPIKIFVVGTQRANFDLSTLKLSVQSSQLSENHVLPLQKSENYFTLPDSLKNPREIELTVKIKDKSETFKFNMTNMP